MNNLEKVYPCIFPKLMKAARPCMIPKFRQLIKVKLYLDHRIRRICQKKGKFWRGITNPHHLVQIIYMVPAFSWHSLLKTLIILLLFIISPPQGWDSFLRPLRTSPSLPCVKTIAEPHPPYISLEFSSTILAHFQGSRQDTKLVIFKIVFTS